MSTTLALTELLGRKVIAADDATEVGEVKNIVLDRGASHVERLHISGRNRAPELVDWSRIQSVGADAVIITSQAAVHASRDDEDDKSYVRGDIEIIGANATTVGGFGAGTISDLHIDSSSGAVTAALTTKGRVPADRIHSLGTFGLVVA